MTCQRKTFSEYTNESRRSAIMKPSSLLSEQNNLHSRLTAFLNGSSLTQLSKLIFPVLDRNRLFFDSSENSLSAIIYAQALAEDFRKVYDRIAGLNVEMSPVEFDDFLGTICDRIHVAEGVAKTVWMELELTGEWITQNLAQDIVLFAVHGSYSTLDYCYNFSDVDTVAVIRRGVVSDPQRLLRLRRNLISLQRWFWQIDPLQHHGVMVIAEEEMDFYPESYFPLELFRYSTLVFDGRGGAPLIFRLRDDTIERRKQFDSFVEFFRKTASRQLPLDSAFAIKGFYSHILLMPCLYLQCKDGRYIYKKYSFDLARKDFSPEIWSIVEESSAIRRKWGYRGRLRPLYGILSRVPSPYAVPLTEIALEKIKYCPITMDFQCDHVMQALELSKKMDNLIKKHETR